MTRTFSKIHGLAGLRVGWAYGSAHVLDALNRVRGPFNLNGAAQAAGVASMEDVAHIEGAIAHNSRWLPWLAEAIAKLGIEVTPSVGNFLLLTFPIEHGRTAADADAFLSARGFILRAVAAYGLPNRSGLRSAARRRTGAWWPRSPNSCGAKVIERLGAPLAEPIFDELRSSASGSSARRSPAPRAAATPQGA